MIQFSSTWPWVSGASFELFQGFRHLNNAMVVGPLVLPYALFLAFAAAALIFYVGKRSGRKAGIEVEPALLQMLLVLLVVARSAGSLATKHRSVGRRCSRVVGEARYRAGTPGAGIHVA